MINKHKILTKGKTTALNVGIMGLVLLFSKSVIAQAVDESIKTDTDIEKITVVSRILSGEFRDDFADSATKTYNLLLQTTLKMKSM